ncbi:MAG TPA: glycine cleavage system protein GcvH [Thermomicrobiales bacterium]|nr:glycine cleavage system protein GcvH [Thermomicrobiales bacterium]
MSAPENRKYTKTHEWVQVDGDVVTVGVTDRAQEELGDITYLELPETGDALTAGEAFGVVESVKAASDIYSPVDGEVVDRNSDLVDAPEMINQSPFDKAWLIKVKIADPSQIDALLSPAEYDEFAGEATH